MSGAQEAAKDVLAAWSERVHRAAADGTALRIVGGGTKDFYGQDLVGEPFPTRAYAGVVDYDPTELVITARCGTPLEEIECTLADARQMLGFEPPRFGSGSTLGGCIAAGLSGPRRPYSGAVRDHVLGVRVLDGKGEDLAFGGRVMKNVAGFDVSRLMAGSLGTLGVLLEVSLRCQPVPKAEATRILELDGSAAVRRMNEWGARALPISATWYADGMLFVRLSGAESAVSSAVREIGGGNQEHAAAFWSAVRDQANDFFARSGGQALWRLSVSSTAPFAELGGAQAVEWGGALRWLVADAADGADLRSWSRKRGGHATLYRGPKSAGAFQSLEAPILGIHRTLKSTFDPAGVFNRRRMYPDF
ncbi:MAG TPA: glycolate oxidase subunit GlcE [Casimicrobiaceae bacterium]|nr:glycolate oxidase subunit GlcE [Casimicrobiaceae bacterium]